MICFLGMLNKLTQLDKQIGINALIGMMLNPDYFKDLDSENFLTNFEESIELFIGACGVLWNVMRNRVIYRNILVKYLKYLPCLKIYIH